MNNEKKSLQELKGSIISSIKIEERKIVRRKIVLSSLAIIASAFSLIFLFGYLRESFYKSGFYEYLSLLSSDSDVVLVYWKDFILSLLDSTPVVYLTLSISSILALLLSVRTFVKTLDYPATIKVN